jgi:serine/threonine-protein kinase
VDPGSADDNEGRGASDDQRLGVRPASNRYILTASLALVFFGLIFGGSYYWRASSNLPSRTESTKIAILPFKPILEEQRNQTLEIGMADTLISRLAGNRMLIVRPLSSVLKYYREEGDVIQAGRSLDVDAVLDGSIQHAGERIRLNVRLSSTKDGRPLWTETFDENFTDIFTVQDAISRKIATALEIHLTVEEESTSGRRYTNNAEAYELFLNGRYYQYKTSSLPDFRKAIAFYERAVEIDPNYAPAFAALADAYRTLPMGGYVASSEAFPRARAAAKRALEIDPNLAEAHIVLGWIGFFYDWDRDAAETELRRALEISPNNSEAHRAYAHLCSILGRHDEAIDHAEIARKLAPLTNLNTALKGQFLFYAGRYDEAVSMFNGVLENDPGNWIAHNGLGRVYILQGRLDEAIESLRRARDLSANATEPVTQLGYALAKSGKRGEAIAALAELQALSADHFVPAYNFAMIYNGLGRRREALDHLEKSLNDREVQISFVNIDTRWDDLRAEPRFMKIIERMRFRP